MKPISSALKAHMASPAATLSWQWIIKRTDGKVFGFTTHVEDLYVPTDIPSVPAIVGKPVGTVLCKSLGGFNPTDIASTSSLSQNNLDIETMLAAAGITEDDLRARLWQAAILEIHIVNYEDLTMGFDPVFYGTLGGITGGDISVKIEQRGLTQPLEANLDGITGPMCRVALGSMGPGKCNKDISSFIRTGVVHGPVGDRLFVDPARSEPDNWWTKGLITLTSGASLGATVEIKRSLANGTIELTDELYYGFAEGDTYSISPGCNKLLKRPDTVYATAVSGSVTSVSGKSFTDSSRSEADDFFDGGLFVWTSGANAGAPTTNVSTYVSKEFSLSPQPVFTITNGDTYTVQAVVGDGDIVYNGDCKVKFNNVLNFQGEPEVPGQIAIQQYGGQTVA